VFTGASSRPPQPAIPEEKLHEAEDALCADRKYHLATYKNCFIGSEFAQWLQTKGLAANLSEAIKIGQQLYIAGYVKHVTDDHEFEDGNFYYRFVFFAELPGRVTIGQLKCADTEICQDRKWRFKTYPKCFLAAEWLDWMLSHGMVRKRADGVKLSKQLFDQGIIQHVVNRQPFKDGKEFFYRFVLPVERDDSYEYILRSSSVSTTPIPGKEKAFSFGDSESSSSEDKDEKEVKMKKEEKDAVDHSVWDRLLKKHVHPGVIDGISLNTFDYVSLLKEDFAEFQSYLDMFAQINVVVLSTNEKIALYINAYNAFCIRHILLHIKDAENPETKLRELGSITGLGTVFAPVWKKAIGSIGSTDVSLDDIEHGILRKAFTEPRVHSCIVCASVSCPELRAEAYVASRLESQMTEQMKIWMPNPKKGFILGAKGKTVEGKTEITVSKIFEWFKVDFKPSVIEFIRPYLPDDIQADQFDNNTKIHVFDYNWNLNARFSSSSPPAPSK